MKTGDFARIIVITQGETVTLLLNKIKIGPSGKQAALQFLLMLCYKISSTYHCSRMKVANHLISAPFPLDK